MAAVKQFPEEVAQKYFKNNFSMYRKGKSFTNSINCFIFKVTTTIAQITITLASQVSYQILGRGYFSVSLFAENKYAEIEGMGLSVETLKTCLQTLVRDGCWHACLLK